jgi:hypothetical protein
MNLLSKTLFLAVALLIAHTSFSKTVASPAVTPAAVDVSIYSFSPSSMSFSGVAAAVTPAPQNLDVKYAGPCDHCPPSINATVPWIVVGKATWSGYSIHYAISINTTGLAAGTYTGKINGSSPDETPTSFTIPVTLTVTGATEYRVSLKWAESTSPEISGYHVWRSQTSGSGFVEIGATVSELSYVDSTVAAGKTYPYYVTAFGPACPSKPTCGESQPSDKITATIPPP